MNMHDKINELLANFALGDLSEDLKTEVATHVSECPQCACELKRLEALLKCTGRISELSADARACEAAEQAVLDAVENQQIQRQSSATGMHMKFVRRAPTYHRKIKLVAAAVFIAAVLGGVTFWPGTTSENGKWWLGPPAAWGQEIMAKLDKIEALVYRDQGVFVGRHGWTHVSGNWSKVYQARDRWRRDTYYEPTDEDTFGDNSPNSVLQDTTWAAPEGQDLKSTTVSYEFRCYTTKTFKGAAYERDPLEKLRSYVRLLDRADRVLDTKIFEGRECVGFEIDTSKYEDNAKGRTDRIWFDVKTKLPVRIEKHGQPLPHGLRGTTIQDRFEYYAKVDAEMFKPRIPDNFINAEPGEMRAAREKKEKGRMVYAAVPSGLGAEITAALKDVKTAVFWEGYGAALDSGTKVSLSERQWRRDSYSNGAPRRTEWFTISKNDPGDTTFDFNDKSFQLTQTIVDFGDKWYKIVKYGRESHPDNPMDRIIFLAGYIDKADRFFESQQIDGIECFGFELSAKKYGSNPDTSKDRIWFDIKTKLPVKKESEWLQDDGPRKRTTGRFLWNPELPAETFEPLIPEGFINVHPDEIQTAGEGQRRK